MATSMWENEMDTMLTAFNQQVKYSLENMKMAFELNGWTFTPEFRQYFLQASNQG